MKKGKGKASSKKGVASGKTSARGRSISIVDDPVALQVIWRRLIAIADEAATTLRRTSFSPIVREFQRLCLCFI